MFQLDQCAGAASSVRQVIELSLRLRHDAAEFKLELIAHESFEVKRSFVELRGCHLTTAALHIHQHGST